MRSRRLALLFKVTWMCSQGRVGGAEQNAEGRCALLRASSTSEARQGVSGRGGQAPTRD